MCLRRLALCLASTLAGLLLTAGLFALAGVAHAAPTTTRPYPGAAPCNTTIQACINGSNPGDVIQVAAGTFTESFTLNKAVSLAGAGADLTTLHAEPNHRVFSVTYTATLPITISALTIAGGHLTEITSVVYLSEISGAGVYLDSAGSAATFDHVVWRDNAAGGYGGGLAAYSPAVILNNQFVNNSASYEGGGLAAQDPVTVLNSSFISNTALFGGGADAFASITLADSLFLSNTADRGGGGLHAFLAVALITATDFIGNQALDGDGGGAYIGAGAGVITGSHFERNQAAREGGGLFLNNGLVSGTQFLSNTARYGGGLAVLGTAAIEAGKFQGNEAIDLGGGAYVSGGAAFTDAVALNNRAGDGGALFFGNGSRPALVTGALLNGNVATTTFGTSGLVFGYVRASTETVDGLVSTVISGPATPGSRAVQAGLGADLALTGTTFSSHTVDLVELGVLAPPFSSPITVTSWPVNCPEVFSVTRPITVWYGTLSSGGVPVFEMTSASDLIASGAYGQARNAGLPAALERGLYAWIDPEHAAINAVLGEFPTYDAEANLRQAFRSAWRPAPYTGVVFDPPIQRGTHDFVLQSTSTLPNPCKGGPPTIEYRFVARLTYIELNAHAARQLFLPLVGR